MSTILAILSDWKVICLIVGLSAGAMVLYCQRDDWWTKD